MVATLEAAHKSTEGCNPSRIETARATYKEILIADGSHREAWQLAPGKDGLRGGEQDGSRSKRLLSHTFAAAAVSAGIHRGVASQALRHSHVTRLIENAVDIGIVHILLDHARFTTTTIYTLLVTNQGIDWWRRDIAHVRTGWRQSLRHDMLRDVLPSRTLSRGSRAGFGQGRF